MVPEIPDYDILVHFKTTLTHVVDHILCNTSDIEDPGSRGFEVTTEHASMSVFVVHKDGEFFAYYNQCPHTGANLEWQEDRFLDQDNALIQCATHDALFLIDTGECIHGPCVGSLLQVAPISVANNAIYLEI